MDAAADVVVVDAVVDQSVVGFVRGPDNRMATEVATGGALLDRHIGDV